MIHSEKLLGNQSYTLTINLKDHYNNTISGKIYWKKSTDSSYSSTSGSTKTITVDKGTLVYCYVYYYASGKEYGTSSTYSWTISSNTTKTFKGTYTTSTTETTWSRPNLSANGTLGGTSFAVEASSEGSTAHAAWYAFDGTSNSDSNRWGSKQGISAANTGAYLIFYNPTAIKVSKLEWYNYTTQYTHYPKTLTLYGSNSNGSWTQIAEGSGSAQPIATLNANSTTFYKYHKLAVTKTSSADQAMICRELVITAKYKTTAYSYYWTVS